MHPKTDAYTRKNLCRVFHRAGCAVARCGAVAGWARYNPWTHPSAPAAAPCEAPPPASFLRQCSNRLAPPPCPRATLAQLSTFPFGAESASGRAPSYELLITSRCAHAGSGLMHGHRGVDWPSGTSAHAPASGTFIWSVAEEEGAGSIRRWTCTWRPSSSCGTYPCSSSSGTAYRPTCQARRSRSSRRATYWEA